MAIPAQYRDGWRYYATVDTVDRMFGDIDARPIEAEIARSDLALPSRRQCAIGGDLDFVKHEKAPPDRG